MGQAFVNSFAIDHDAYLLFCLECTIWELDEDKFLGTLTANRWEIHGECEVDFETSLCTMLGF